MILDRFPPSLSKSKSYTAHLHSASGRSARKSSYEAVGSAFFSTMISVRSLLSV